MKVLYMSAALLFCMSSGFAQTINNPDSVFLEARQLAFDDRYEEARALAYQILISYPEYHDVRILVGRTYAWQSMHWEARVEFDYVLDRKPDYADALYAATDNEIWANNPDKALTYNSQLLEYYPFEIKALLKRAEILVNADRKEEAEQILRRVERVNPDNPEIEKIRMRMKVSGIKNRVGAGYTYDSFSSVFGDIQKGFVQYARDTGLGPITGRIHYQNRFGQNGVQLEADYYPAIAQNWYGFLSLGYSSSVLFPELRGGAELHHILPGDYELSAGFRYLNFNAPVWILTGSAGKYMGNWLFILRPFFTPNSVEVSQSYNMIIRRYFTGTQNYLNLRGGFGFSPEERRFQDIPGNIFLTRAETVGLEWYTAVGTEVFLRTSVDYTRQALSDRVGTFSIITMSASMEFRF